MHWSFIFITKNFRLAYMSVNGENSPYLFHLMTVIVILCSFYFLFVVIGGRGWKLRFCYMDVFKIFLVTLTGSKDKLGLAGTRGSSALHISHGQISSHWRNKNKCTWFLWICVSFFFFPPLCYKVCTWVTLKYTQAVVWGGFLHDWPHLARTHPDG